MAFTAYVPDRQVGTSHGLLVTNVTTTWGAGPAGMVPLGIRARDGPNSRAAHADKTRSTRPPPSEKQRQPARSTSPFVDPRGALRANNGGSTAPRLESPRCMPRTLQRRDAETPEDC